MKFTPPLLTPEYFDRLEITANYEDNPVTYLSIDPGKANGVCGYDDKYQLMWMHTVRANDMIQFVNKFRKIKVCIIEDFLLYPNKAQHQNYSNMETSRVIGKVESWAELNNVKLVKQKADIKPNGYKWIGEKPLPKTNPMNHMLDAHVHFMFWAIKNGHINVATLL